MASYAMAHLKLDMLLAETGYRHESNERLRVFLTNSLEEHDKEIGTLFNYGHRRQPPDLYKCGGKCEAANGLLTDRQRTRRPLSQYASPQRTSYGQIQMGHGLKNGRTTIRVESYVR